MNKPVQGWIRQCPELAFFIVAIAISFLTLFTAIYFIPRDSTPGQLLIYYLSSFGTYSPAIAAIIVTRAIRSDRVRVPFLRKLAISLPVWIIAMTVNIANLRTTAPPGATTAGLVILSLPVSLLPVWVITKAYSGSEGVRKMLKTLIKPGGHIIYYLIALFTFPVLSVAGMIITNLWNDNALLPQVNQADHLLLNVIITFFSVLLFSGGLNEESGWRGFAQLRLQARYSPLITALILWLFMVIWHIPNDIIQYQNGGYLLMRIGLYPFITILFSWIFIRTNGNIWPVAVFHASMNSMNPLMG
ncbi:MAG TPA: CPBP family intramembrane metalloprotease, partial [Bacteroidales bacterium]|nr:CPBP family intramembrane metalloprotease [Bacteroidales bacterium]